MMMMMTTAVSLKIHVFWDCTLYQLANSFCTSNDRNVFMFSHSVLDSDMWLTVHRNSVWITNQLDVTLCNALFFPL